MNKRKLWKLAKQEGEKVFQKANQKINQSVDELKNTVSQTPQNLSEKLLILLIHFIKIWVRLLKRFQKFKLSFLKV